MEDLSQVTIWRYIDLAKFVSLLANEALYFACPSELHDPYEGYLPRQYVEAFSGALQEMVDDLLKLRAQILDKHADADLRSLDEGFLRMRSVQHEALKKVRLRFGVSCWHMGDYESEAMWKLYSASGQGIAIASSVQQLEESIVADDSLVVDRVRYVDFAKDSVEKGHRHYTLFLKRKSFEHERELRATIRLREEGKGSLVKCDLNTLINRVHVSPFAESYLKPIVEYLCAARPQALNKPVIQSSLFDQPDYGIEIHLPPDFTSR
jgi:hypothetical protein